MTDRAAVLLLAAGQTLAWASIYYVFPALLLRWESAEGWPKQDLTAAFTLAVLISALAAPLAGRLIDAGRGPGLMAGAAVLGGLGVAALSQATQLWQFYAAWAVTGLAMAGCLYEPCFALVTRARGGGARRAITLITLVAGFASSLSFPAAYGLSEAFGRRTALMVFAVGAAGLAAPLLWLGARGLEARRVPEPPRQAGVAVDAVEAARARLLAQPVFWALALGFALGAVAHGATLHHLLPILADRGVAAGTTVIAASFIGPMQVAGRLAMVAAGPRVPVGGLALAAFLMMALAIVSLAAAGRSAAFLVGFVILFGGAYGTISILRPVIAREILGGEGFGVKSGALAVPYLIGSASAPWLGALVWQAGGYGLLLGLLVVVLLAGAALLLLCFRMARARGFGRG